jgi:predicted dehydrogenase
MGGQLGELEIDVEDTAATTLECHSGNHRVAIQVHHSFLQRPPSRTCEIIGERGTIRIDLRANSIRVDGAIQEQQTFTVARNQLFLDELRQFLDASSGKGTPVVTVREAAMSLRVALAAKASLAAGQVVELA